VRVRIPIQDYMSLPVAVMIWATGVNTQTDRQTAIHTDIHSTQTCSDRL